MMEMAKVTSKGQITIPISIRRRLGINEGDKLLFINRPEGVMMVNPDTFQGDVAELAVESEAPKKSSAAAQPAATSPAAPSAVSPAAPQPAPQAAQPAPAAAERRYIPPMDEPAPDRPSTQQVGNLDLSTLLDDIRSIGSKI